MRTRVMFTTAALLLASAGLAAAQQQPPITQPAAPSIATPRPTWLGSIDFGVRGRSTEGDVARFERYGDTRDGAASRLFAESRTDRYLFSATATNVGYRDQRYLADYAGGAVRAQFAWDSTPLNYSYLSSTPWVTASPGVLTLDAAARLAVQNKVPGIVGVPASATQLLTPSIFRGLASPLDLQQRRDTGALALAIQNGDLATTLAFSSTKKIGAMPWGASFAFNDANEIALPLDNRTNDVTAGLEWTNQKGMVRVGWTGSWFDNRIDQLVWDNPLRATDTNPFDPSGYSNGNGPAQGRMALAPSNHMNVVSATGLYKMPAHSSLHGTFSVTSMKQNEALIPWTINPVIEPLMPALERATAEADVRGINALINFSTRPNRRVGLTARYRFNDHENRTPMFDAREYVRFDAVPEHTGGETEPFNVRRNTFDLNATFHLVPYTAFRVGYGYDAYDRTGRAFTTMADNTVRASVDTVGNQYVTVRGIYEHVFRTGSGLSVETITAGGGQPDLRFYDEANRDRDRGTILLVVNPVSMVDLSLSFAGGKDKYDRADQYFGLLDNTNKSVNVGFNVAATEKISFGANYGRDTYSSLQRSRNANPPPDPQFSDTARDWTLNNDEVVNNVDAYVDVRRAIRNTDISVGYGFSDSDNAFVHGGPRIDALKAAGTFLPVPNVTNTWRRATVEVKYFFAPKVGLGLGYWYEKFDVTDFATIDLPGQPGTPRIDYLGEISTGYGNRPYKANTGFLRLLVLF